MNVRLFCCRRHKARNERCVNKACLCRWNVVCAILLASKLDRDFSCCCPASELFEEHLGMTEAVSILESEEWLRRRHIYLSSSLLSNKSSVSQQCAFWIGSILNQKSGSCASVAFHWASKVKDILGDICCFSGQFLLASLGICWHTELSAGAPESPWEKGFGSSEPKLVSKQLSYFCYVDIPCRFSTNVVAFSVYWPFWLTNKNKHFQMHTK